MAEEVEVLFSSDLAFFAVRDRGLQAALIIDGERIEEELPIMEGRMRARLLAKRSRRLLEALDQDRLVEFEFNGRKALVDSKGFHQLWEKRGEWPVHYPT